MSDVLTVEAVPAYLRANPDLAGPVEPDRPLDVREVGDGNLNLVFVVHDDRGAGVVLKQALPYVRMVGPEWPLSPTRAHREADAYEVHGAADPEHVPALYGRRDGDHLLAVEDLSDHRVWRRALDDGERHPHAAAALGRYVARVAFATSPYAMAGPARRVAVARSANPELCDITEQLVFTEPYADHERNSWHPDLTEDVLVLRRDEAHRAGIAELRHRFQTAGEALIHGDLHTGSVMVRGGSTKPFDLEFACYGPVGFDLGAVVANVLLAAARATVLGRDDQRRWLLTLPAELWAAFEAELRSLWPGRTEAAAWPDAELDRWLRSVAVDTAGMAGAKVARRIIGLAKVSDIETLPPPQHVAAARLALRAARELVVRRAELAPDELGSVLP